MLFYNSEYMKLFKYTLLHIIVICSIVCGCSEDIMSTDGTLHGKDKIELSCEINQLAVTRVNDNGFCNGDVMGVYITDYNGNTPGKLTTNDNHVNNIRFTFDEPNNKWNSAYDIYWIDKHTHIDVYGYYPYANPESIEDYQFEVKRDQSTESATGEMGGYEASDFLWGSVKDVAPTSNAIQLSLSHRMSNARVTLIEGSGFASGEWAKAEKIVLLPNVIRKASINLSDGTIKAAGEVESKATVPSRTGDEWRTIVVPQTVAAGTTLFSITIDGMPYKFTKNENLTYVAGKMMNFGIKVDKLAGSGDYKLTLVSESITPWENDLVSHDATTKEYVIVNSTATHLKDSIQASGKDFTKIKNLKVTGTIDVKDFEFMKEQMISLKALNLKDVIIGRYMENDAWKENRIPNEALSGTELTNIILPDNITSIGNSAFSGCKYLTGSLIIPEGVTEIEDYAFAGCSSLTGNLSLPSTLKKIDNEAFYECKFTCNLILPEGLEIIGAQAFNDCDNLYGELHLPSSLKTLKNGAFGYCKNLTGSLVIPQAIKVIEEYTFCYCGFDGSLVLPDGITKIEQDAFVQCPFKGELVLPKNITTIEEFALYNCNFSGKLSLPKSLTTLGEWAFGYCHGFTGTLEIPEGITCISQGCFKQCTGIERLVLPKNLESISSGAFTECFGISSIVCKSEDPPYLNGEVFTFVAKDNFALEVPEPSIINYKTATGWKEFKRITAHHELYAVPSVISGLNSEHKETITLYAEGEWEVASKPIWVKVSPSNGSKKTRVTLTISSMAKNASTREGKVVFRLKDKDYTYTCNVSQYGYQYNEDEWITLQKATKGNNGGINIVLLGDGYNAKDISDGSYLKDIKQQMEYFFAIEPYKTYRKYFNVYTAIPLSTESGISGVNTIVNTRFNTTYTSGVGLQADYGEIFAYALNAPTVNKSNLNQTLIIMVPNSTEYGGITNMWNDGSAIAFCPKSNDPYPYDMRGIVQHEAGGHGFGKLADEYIYTNAFIDACNCHYDHSAEIRYAQANGWYTNISLSGKTNNVSWSHLIFDPRYSDIVDIFEGAFRHSRGVFRSEKNSCMNNNIPYYNTISRETIVKRIKQYAGETYSFEDFVKNDSRETALAKKSRGYVSGYNDRNNYRHQLSPVIHRGSPLKMKKVRVHK